MFREKDIPKRSRVPLRGSRRMNRPRLWRPPEAAGFLRKSCGAASLPKLPSSPRRNRKEEGLLTPKVLRMVFRPKLKPIDFERLHDAVGALFGRTPVHVALFSAAFLWFWLVTLSGVAYS